MHASTRDWYLQSRLMGLLGSLVFLPLPASAQTSQQRPMPLATTTHPQLGFTIDVPPQATTQACGTACVRFVAELTTTAPAVMTVSVSRLERPLDEATAQDRVRTSTEHPIVHTERLRAGHLLYVITTHADTAEYWYFARLQTHTLQAVCRGPQSNAADLERVCRSLRPFTSPQARSQPALAP